MGNRDKNGKWQIKFNGSFDLRLWDAVHSVDLATARGLVMRDYGWSEQRTDVVEAEYRRWLYAAGMMAGESVVPTSTDMDLLWHAHVLCTRAYARDCQTMFGGFLHHEPNIGSGDGEVTEGQLQVMENTLIAHFLLFDEPCDDMTADCARGCDGSTPGCNGVVDVVSKVHASNRPPTTIREGWQTLLGMVQELRVVA